MFTVCSKCNLRLSVTATDLRAAQGYVRCGRCHNVFNALAALADDPAQPVADATTADTQRRPVLKPPEPPLPEVPPEPPLEAPPQAAPPLEDNSPTDTSLEFNPASTNISEVFIEANAADRSGTFESIVLVGEEPVAADAAPQSMIAPQALSDPGESPAADEGIPDPQRLRDALAEPDPRPAAPPEPRPAPLESANAPAAGAATATPEAPAAPAGTGDSLVSESEPLPFMPDWSDAPDPAPDPAWVPPETLEATPASEPRPQAVELSQDAAVHAAPAPRLPPWAGRLGAVALGLCLLFQVVHHYRNELAGTAALREPLVALYGALGAPLAPRWDIGAYEIRQLGATTDGAAAGDLVVRASISNHAPRAQPLPLLRVVMQDQFGNRVAGRDLQPAEYLGAAAPHAGMLAPGQRVDVQVDFRDPGQAVTGFELDACMTGRDRTVSCANDPGTH